MANSIKEAHALNHNARLESRIHNVSWLIYKRAIETCISVGIVQFFAPLDLWEAPGWMTRFGTLNMVPLMVFCPCIPVWLLLCDWSDL